MTRLLILGGTGFVGRSLIARLVSQCDGGGLSLRVPTRRLRQGRRLQSLPGVELVEADVHQPETLTALLQGCDAVVNLIAILHGSREAFDRVHVELPRKLAAACQTTGVRRMVHISALGVAGHPPSDYLRSKQAGESALRAVPLELSVLRPSVIFGQEDRLLNLFAAMQRLAPVVPLAMPDAQFQPVWVEDVSEAIVRCLARPSAIGQYIECAGPQVLTLREIVSRAGRWSGHPRRIVGLSPALGRLQARVLECLPGGPLMSRDNLASMRVPNVASGALAGLASLGIAPQAMDVVAPTWLAPDLGPQRRLDHFRASAGRS